MQLKKILLAGTVVLSLFFGCLFFMLMEDASHTQSLQYGFLGFLIGTAMVWLVYLSVRFIARGFRRTAFPGQSRRIIAFLEKYLKLRFNSYQKKMLVEITGALIMISTGLGLAGAAFIIVSGLVYVAGRLAW